jgi:hypothetical protein
MVVGRDGRLIGTVVVSMRQGREQKKTRGALLSESVLCGLQTADQLLHTLLSTVQVWYNYCCVRVAIFQYHRRSDLRGEIDV